MLVKLSVEAKLPRLPNFIDVDGVSRDVADFDDETLEEIGKAWTAELLRHAAVRRASLVAAGGEVTAPAPHVLAVYEAAMRWKECQDAVARAMRDHGPGFEYNNAFRERGQAMNDLTMNDLTLACAAARRVEEEHGK